MNDNAADRWRRKKALFQEALACEAPRRGALLEGVRASDPGLADEVAAMLAAHEAEGAFLAEPFVAPRRDVWLGETLEGKYRVEERLGRGGMGSVYRATHLWTGRAVAVKIIAPEFMARAEFVERFKREAKAAGRLRHPNVVNVTDFGFDEAGARRTAYLVMEYLDGETLAERLDREPKPPLAFVVDLLEQVCLAVDEAHYQGILHRDLKPSNIWLEPDGRGGQTVKVLDFGLAKLREAEAGERPAGDPRPASALPGATEHGLDTTLVEPSVAPTLYDDEPCESVSESATRMLDRQATPGEIDPRTIAYHLTRVGTVMGTPAYMSPEQWRAERLTPASDVYALGVIVYEMLGGALPFSGKNEELFVKHTEMPPPSLRCARRELTAELDRLVTSALAKSPAERPPSAGAFAAGFKAIAEGEPALVWRSRQALQTELGPIRPQGSFRQQRLTIRILFSLFGCFGIAALTYPWPVVVPGGEPVQFALWAVPLVLFLTAIDAGSMATLAVKQDLVRLRTFIAASLATVRPAWVLAVQVLAAEGGSARSALERSRHLLEPFPSFARAAFLRRLLRGLAILSMSVATYAIASDALGAPVHAVAWVALSAVAGTLSVVAASRDGAARATLYEVARASRGEAAVVAARGPVLPFRRRRGRGPALVAFVVLASLAVGVIHIIFVPPFGPLPRAPRPQVARVPDAENAWVEYHRAITAAGFDTTTLSEQARQITSLSGVSRPGAVSADATNALKAYSTGARPSLDERERTLVDANAAALEHLLAGARCPRAQFTTELSGFDSPIPTMMGARGVVALACAKARVAANEGRTAEALELYLAAYEMSTDYSEPSTGLVGGLIAADARNTVAHALNAYIGRGGADAASEVELARQLAELDSRMLGAAETLFDIEDGIWLRGLEDAFVTQQKQTEFGFSLFDDPLIRPFGRARGLRTRYYLGMWDLIESRRAEQRPILERWDVRAFDAAQTRYFEDLANWNWSPDVGWMIARMTGMMAFASLTRAASMMYEDRVSNAAVRAMLIADAHRKKHGAFPERLDEAAAALGLEAPRDVATGATIDYRIENGVPVVRASAADVVVRFGEARDLDKR